ncbi:MAG: AMP-binding protein [Dehalococcoidia bacterium]|nr:AMP-binding protein [Dehalococcoidia bacterium]
MNVSDGIVWASYRSPNKAAVVADDGVAITYRELDESANRIGRFLRDVHRVNAGDRVGILAGSTIQFLEAFYGVVRAGGIAVPLNDQWGPAELEACLAQCCPVMILTGPVDSSASCKRRIVDFGVPVVEIDQVENAGLLGAVLAGSSLPEEPGKDDFFYIGYTSGSTGRPKGVLRRHGSWLDSYQAASIEFGCSRADRVLAPGALFYSLSLFAVTHALFLGSTAYIMSGFDPRRLLEMVEREKVTTICMVPTLYEAVLNENGASRRDLSSVRTLICAGSNWPRAKQSKERVLAMFPSAGLYEYYGAAEMSFVSTSHPEEQMRRPRSAGRPFLGVRVQIRGEDGQLLGSGEIGTLFAQSSYGFEGYYADSGRTAKVLHDGWMTVGDLAYADEEGYLYVVGRKDNVVISGGVNVSVEEVEEVLNGHPLISLAAVFGIDDPLRGQVLVALVQRRKGSVVHLRELRDYCAARIDRHKVPRRLRFVDALPLTPSGKINRSELPHFYAAITSPGSKARR